MSLISPDFFECIKAEADPSLWKVLSYCKIYTYAIVDHSSKSLIIIVLTISLIMKLFTPAAFLLSAAFALPPATQQDATSTAFKLNLSFSDSPLNGPLNANGGSFWVGKPSASYCPSTVSGCKLTNHTSFIAQGEKLYLNVGVPGGQEGKHNSPM